MPPSDEPIRTRFRLLIAVAVSAALLTTAVVGLIGLAGHSPRRPPPPTSSTSGPTVPSGPSVSSSTSTAPAGPRVLYGITVDDVSDFDTEAAALGRLPERATVRVYFDASEPATYYLPALRRFHSVATVMGELLDSSDETSVPVAAVPTRVGSYLATLGPYVDIWEVGNEVNGNFTGSYPDVASRLLGAYRAAAAAHVPTALTLYANEFGPDNCGDGPSELTPSQFSRQYIPADVARHLDYVFLSYYPSQCGGAEPGSAGVAKELETLHRIFPSASLGFGEMGLPDPATPKDAARAAQIMSWAYSLDPHLPYYVGGYFWWYGAEDVLAPGGLLAGDLSAAFGREKAVLG